MSEGDGGDAQRLLELLGGKWIAQAVSTAADLRIAEALASGPRDATDLAGALGCDVDGLTRLIAALVGLGLLAREADGRVRLTGLGSELRHDRLGALAAFVGEPAQWDPWARLREALREGGVAFERTHGRGLFAHLAAHPEESARYDRAVDAFTRAEGRSLADAVDFDAGGTVVDVGGGRGALLHEVLTRWEGLHGVLYDLPHVARTAATALGEELGDRVRVVAGDFHASVPEGGDWYVLRHVLHNWDDARAVALMGRCAAAMARGGRVLVIEGVLLPGDRLDTTRLLDLEMLVLTEGGRERSKPELRRLFVEAGLTLGRSAPLASFARLFELRRRGT